MHAPQAEAHFDWLVVTTSSARQAAACRVELADRARRGALPAGCQTLVVPDAGDRRIGSGGATVLALAALAARLAAKAVRGASFRSLFSQQRILLIHSGGDSRRLSPYSAEGKLFAPLPLWGQGFRCAAVFDLLLDEMLALRPRGGGEVIIAPGDAVVALRRQRVDLTGTGIVGLGAWVSPERAGRHGVFALATNGRRVHAFLQKPTHEQLRAARALDRQGRALLDTGLLSFDPPSTAALLEGAGVQLSGARQPRFVSGGLAASAQGAAAQPCDLYREILCGLPASANLKRHLDQVEQPLRGALARTLKRLRRVDFTCCIIADGSFVHVGTIPDLLERGGGAAVPRAPKHQTGRGKAAVLDSIIGHLHVGGGRTVIDRCILRSARLAGQNVVVGIADGSAIELPRGIALFRVPLIKGAAVVACGVRDDFKTPLLEGGLAFERPFASLLRRSGLLAGDLIHGDGTLWHAPLWPITTGANGLRLVRWMWNGTRAPAAWQRARRVSMHEIAARADIQAIVRERRMIELRGARTTSEATLLRVRSPLERASRAAAVAAATVRAKGTTAARRIARLRTLTFEAIGESVLAQSALPHSPPRSTILHDQAVWASAPVRVDLAGGWTDTPPICTEVGGAVVNVAVALRGQLPVQVMAKLLDEPVIRITSTDLGQTRVIRSSTDLRRRADPTHWAALAESALVLSGIAPADTRQSLPRWLARVGGGVSLTLFSAVPKGSGLGTSSILGATTIRAIDGLLGRQRSADELVCATSALEQMLSTRGGWQDQVGATMGGFKLATTVPGNTQSPRIEPIRVPQRAQSELLERSILYFTGQRRLARNILENVVWNWLQRHPEAIEAVRQLHDNAAQMRVALEQGAVDTVIHELNRFRQLKRQLDPGSCTPGFETLAQRWRTHLSGWCFAGAGGGGFMLLVARDASHADAIRRSIDRDRPHPRARAFELEIDAGGLRCAVL